MTRDQYATWQPSPNYESGRAGMQPSWIILHGTAGGGAVEWLTNPASQVSAHYVIRQDGVIYQLVDESDTAWANGGMSQGRDSWWTNFNPNYATISIEHEKPDATNNLALTAAQTMSSFQLIARICQRWNIPARQASATGGITGHYSMDPVNRSHCPGTYPWNDLMNFLQQTHGDTTDMLQIGTGMGAYFVDLGGTPQRWHCKSTNVDLIGDHLNFYRRYEGVFGLPLSNEIYLSNMKDSAIVVYERGVACYDPQGKYDKPAGAGTVYLMHLNSGVAQQMIAKPLLIALQTQCTVLNNQVLSLQAQLAKAQPAADPAQLQAIQNELNSYKLACHNVLTSLQQIGAK